MSEVDACIDKFLQIDGGHVLWPGGRFFVKKGAEVYGESDRAQARSPQNETRSAPAQKIPDRRPPIARYTLHDRRAQGDPERVDPGISRQPLCSPALSKGSHGRTIGPTPALAAPGPAPSRARRPPESALTDPLYSDPLHSAPMTSAPGTGPSSQPGSAGRDPFAAPGPSGEEFELETDESEATERREPRHRPIPARSSVDPSTPASVLLLNHHRDDLGPLIEALTRAGHEVRTAQSVAESHRLLSEVDPELIVLNPLVVEAGCLEFELVQNLQKPGVPVPVVVAVDDPRTFDRSAGHALAIRDFVTRPIDVEECLQRIRLALETRRHFVTLHERALELEGQVSRDHKTELLSERYFRQLMAMEFKRARRHRTPLSLCLIDVDNFKAVNDTTSYAFGDEVLRHIAQTLKENIRETDFAARFGGDEFVLLLPHTTMAEAVHTAMRIRSKVSETAVQDGISERSVTISVGIDTYDGILESSPEELRQRANRALHQAKRRGKNKVWLHGDDDVEDGIER